MFLDVNLELLGLEYELAKWANTETRLNIGKTISVCDEVALFMPEWDKWVRARIVCPAKDINIDKYMLWTTDYALPVYASEKRILPLPPHIANDNLQVVFIGGLSNCVPSQREFSLETAKAVQIMVRKWPELAVSTFYNLWKKSVLIEFKPEYRKGSRVFGSIEFFNRKALTVGQSILQELNCGMISTDFLNDLDKIDTFVDRPWLDDNGNVFAYKAILSKDDNDQPIELMAFGGGASDESQSDDDEEYDSATMIGLNTDAESIFNGSEYNDFFDESASMVNNLRATVQAEQYERAAPSLQERLAAASKIEDHRSDTIREVAKKTLPNNSSFTLNSNYFSSGNLGSTSVEVSNKAKNNAIQSVCTESAATLPTSIANSNILKEQFSDELVDATIRMLQLQGDPEKVPYMKRLFPTGENPQLNMATSSSSSTVIPSTFAGRSILVSPPKASQSNVNKRLQIPKLLENN